MQAVSARRMRGPSDDRQLQRDAPAARQAPLGVKPPSGPTSSAARPVRRHDAQRRVAALDGGEQAAVRAASRPAGRRAAVPGAARGTVRRSDCSAASMAMAVSRSAFIRCGVAALGDDRQQGGNAEFGRLLHHQIGGVALQQREYQPQIGLRRLGSEPALDRAGWRGRDGWSRCARRIRRRGR